MAVPAPALTAIGPNQGPVSGGTPVTLTGVNLTAATAVKFGSAAATSFTVASDSTVVAVAPAVSGAGSVQVTVTTASGTSNALAYTYVSVPALVSATPNQGPLSGGTPVTLSGSHLTGASAIAFGSTAATSFTVISGTQIEVSTPPGAPGPVGITVTTPGGTSTANVYYYYVGAPVLTSATPNQGPASGGTSITLTGSHLVGATAVKFGSVAAASFSVASDTTITAVAPPGTSGPVAITVTTPGGITPANVYYYYLGAPALTGATPNQGPASGGTPITLTGGNLTSTTAVKFGSTAATSFTVVSDGIIVAVAPPGTGVSTITAASPGGISNGLTYTYLSAPSI
jgi:IPT/TIG domain